MKHVLFVCLGNICRSPAAEGIFRSMVADANLADKIQIDSCGTGAWHVGEAPDLRMTHHARLRGYDLTALEARQFSADSDFEKFDYILTMDNSNLRNVLALDTNHQYKNKIQPLLNFCKVHSIREVPDPYYEGDEGFEHVMDLLEDSCAQLLQHLRREL